MNFRFARLRGVFRPGCMKLWIFICVFASCTAYAQDAAKTALSSDHEFDKGSRVKLETMTPVQVENLAILGRVWGFLKYHHPSVTSGQRHWDYDLLRVLPAVLAAPDRAAADEIFHSWISSLGKVADCKPCATLRTENLHLRPDLDLLDEGASLSAALRSDLKRIYINRSAADAQFYLTKAPHIGNPVFQNEPSYNELEFPDAGYQLLALFRFWNIVVGAD